MSANRCRRMADPRETDHTDRSTPPERDLARRSQGGPMPLVAIGVLVMLAGAAYVLFALL